MNGLPCCGEPRGVEHQVLPRLDLGRHVGQLELNALELRDRPDRTACASIVYCSACSNAPSAIPSDSAAMPMRPLSSVRMKLHEPRAFVAEQILGRNFDVLHDQLARVRRAPAELVLLLAGAEALHRRQRRLVSDADGLARLRGRSSAW